MRIFCLKTFGVYQINFYFCSTNTVDVAQLVRASVCGTEGRGFEPHIPPQFFKAVQMDCFFCFAGYESNMDDTWRL